MGALTLPESGAVYVDTNCIIYAIERVPEYADLLDPVWAAANHGRLQLVSSELVWLETLVKPLKTRQAELESLFRRFLSSRELRLEPIDRAILELAARLRADCPIKTPDAIHAATAIVSGVKLFLTNDVEFRRIPELGAVLNVLSDSL